VIEQFIRQPAAGDFVHAQAPLYSETAPGNGFGDSVSDSSGVVVIFDGDQPTTGVTRTLGQRLGVDRLE
jgi:hypothetical protein